MPKAPIKKGGPPAALRKKYLEEPEVVVASTGANSAEKYRLRTDKLNAAYREVRQASRDIAPLPKITEEDWQIRLSLKNNLKLFSETILPNTFYLNWSLDQLRCISKLETVFLESGKFALAMPRGGGKTALTRSAILWGTAFSHKKFPFLLGSRQDKAQGSLEYVKAAWYQSPLLLRLFPEVAYCIRRIENRWHLAKAQTYNRHRTHLEWGTESVTYPCLLLSEKEAESYLKHDPSSVKYLEEYKAYMPSQGGIILGTSGIDGSVRGEAGVHPLTLAQPRPDVVVIDDVQKDSAADSPIQVKKLKELIAGALLGLAGPDTAISAIMPCTVTREGDVSDDYLDPLKHPEWRGERCGLVKQWPEGVNNEDISLETEEGKAWNTYNDLRKDSLRMYGDNRLGSEYYLSNREVMDRNFVCSWEDRYDKRTQQSAQQYAMDLRLESPQTFIAEYQNIGKRLNEGAVIPISADQLSRKVINCPRFYVPSSTTSLVAFIDVQDEILPYAFLASEPNFTAVVPEYGTWPVLRTREWTKDQSRSWKMLTDSFFQEYPDHKKTDEKGRVIAPIEAKLYHGLTKAVDYLLNLQFKKLDEKETPQKIDYIGIDTRWGQLASTIKTFIRNHPAKEKLVAMIGVGIPPTQRQIEQYTRYPGWTFESQVCPLVREDKWYYSPDNGGQYRISTDVNRMKSFILQRFASPPGISGCWSLYAGSPEEHELFSKHVCDSEYPQRIECKPTGVIKDMWAVRQGNPDNEYLDIICGCASLASKMGCYVLPGYLPSAPKKKRKLSELWDQKHKMKT